MTLPAKIPARSAALRDASRMLLPAVVALLLSACGGDDRHDGASSSHAYCATFSSLNPTTTAQCTGCTASNASAIADGNLDSYADIQIATTSVTATATLRATTAGTQFSAGGNVGAYLTNDIKGNSVGSNAVTLNTYLGGVLQETAATPTIALTNGGTGAEAYFSFKTTKAYDAVEAVLTDMPGGGSVTTRVYELCADGAVK